MLPRAPKRRIFIKTGVSSMPPREIIFIINTCRHVRHQNFIFWCGNNVDDPWPMESPGDITRFAQSPNALRMS